ncbi:neuroparsin-A-like [Apis dorsata]|uniref:neuroparsin-A-like n=1 Tax=Apis dorsata TaxID=7462 RepID=UPI0003DF712F|nr:neuroparsin-A-like [Apis dorsata]XP_031369388.1 neuroparsin-A-like [Apis dorsata]XP_031369389.1 neuroparsin-A-like [Apis dorsata]
MFAIQTIRIAVLLAIVFLFDKCSGYPSIKYTQKQGITSCNGCGDSCHKCKYGIAISSVCGIEQCAKGPDELCGGPQNFLGICAEGMQCSCNKCIGCSAEKFECSKTPNPCLPHRSSESRDVNKFRKWSSIAIN